MEVRSRTINGGEDLETVVKVEWVSKELVLQLCMKHLGMIQPDTHKNNVQVNVNAVANPNLVKQLREAVAGKIIDGTVIGRLAST
jgi:hypothetical protein